MFTPARISSAPFSLPPGLTNAVAAAIAALAKGPQRAGVEIAPTIALREATSVFRSDC